MKLILWILFLIREGAKNKVNNTMNTMCDLVEIGNEVELNQLAKGASNYSLLHNLVKDLISLEMDVSIKDHTNLRNLVLRGVNAAMKS